MKTKQKLFLIILIFFVLSCAFALFARQTGDGAWHLGIIRFMSQNKKIPTFEPLGRMLFTRPPLFHLVSSVFYFVFGLMSINMAETIVRILPVVFGSLSLYFTFLIVKKLFNKDTALYATLFLAFLPLFFFVSFRTIPTMLGVLLTTIAVYFALEKRFVLSGLFVGLSLLAKEQSLFIIFPVLFIIIFSNINKKKILIKNLFLFLLITLVIASPHYINNFIKVGDPIFPFGGFFFDSPYKQEGVSLASNDRTPLSFSNLMNPEYSVVQPYLEFFGVPHSSSTDVLFFFDIPFLKLLLGVWFVATMIFLIPLFYGFLKINKKSFKFKLVVIWIGSFLALMYSYLFIVGDTTTGYLLSGLPALALLWGFGFFSIIKHFNKFKKLILLIFILIIIGFISSAFIKIAYTNNAYSFYQHDFDWIKENIPETSVVYFNDQSLTYNTNQFSRFFLNLSELKTGFILVSQNYTFNSGRAVLPEETLKEIENSSRFVLVYNNNITGSRIYEIKE